MHDVEFAPKPPAVLTTMFQLEVTLNGTEPPVWRRMIEGLVPVDWAPDRFDLELARARRGR